MSYAEQEDLVPGLQRKIAALEAENLKLTTKLDISDALWQARDPFGIEKQLEAENAKLRAVVEAGKIMRMYCLGSDASTENMLKRYDNALAKLETRE